MKGLLILLSILGFIGGVVYLGPSTKEVSYVGKCFTVKHENAFIASVKIKIDRIRDDGKLNVIINSVPKPTNAEEIFFSVKINEYNNSWADAEQLKEMNEVPCD